MPRPAASAAALLSLALVAACDLPFLPKDDWVDVSWRLTTVDGQSAVGSSFTRPVGTYVYDGEDGPVECAVEAFLRDSEPWGWTENMATRAVDHWYPEGAALRAPPYHFLALYVDALCGEDEVREWYLGGVAGGDFGIEDGDLSIRSIYMWDGYLNGTIAGATEFGEWVTLGLPERIALDPWMYLPLELTLRPRSPDGTVLAEVSDTLELGYLRRERLQR